MKFVIKKESKKEALKNKIVIEGYCLPSRNHSFIIEDEIIKSIIVTNKKLAHKFASRAAFKKYNKLIKTLTDLYIDEEDNPNGMVEILNQIEKFKIEIKIKYRKYLKKKELEEMASKLKFMQKQAKEKQYEIYYNSVRLKEKTTNRTR